MDTKEIFSKGYKHLPDEIYRKLEFHPATYEVIEHHIKVYAEKGGDRIARADHPKEMLDKSIATPSMTAAIINAKYTNAMPLYRQEKEFERNDIHISRQVMANWVIRVTERYLSLIYDRLKEELLKTPVTHADETPVIVNKDGRKGTHQNYMWVYRTGEICCSRPVVIYEYQKERNASHPREATASAMLYSLVETSKANNLKIYDYLKYLLSEIPKHVDQTDTDFIENLLPWSENLPEECRKTKN